MMNSITKSPTSDITDTVKSHKKTITDSPTKVIEVQKSIVTTTKSLTKIIEVTEPIVTTTGSSITNISRSKKSTSSTTTTTKKGLSPAATWHVDRRREMLRRHPKEIRALESSRSLPLTGPLLLFTNAALTALSLFSGTLQLPRYVFLAALTVGSVLSLWQLQLLHEVLHGAMLGSGTKAHRRWHRRLLFWGSLPSAFGYWLYLEYGHLSHHRIVGGAALNDAFAGADMDLADGDVLFVNHRMDMKGEAGPRMKLPGSSSSSSGGAAIVLSVGRFFFKFWKQGRPLRNAFLFSTSFMLERVLLVCNDVVVALTGTNSFFPNKPRKFHHHVATYARVGLAVKFALCVLAGALGGTRMRMLRTTFPWSWNPVLFLMWSETLWSLPPHPACAMFITNHGSSEHEHGGCEPTGSTYAGRWYSILTLGTNYHVEHHDFPNMPLHQLGKLRKIAGSDFYRTGTSTDGNNSKQDNLGEIIAGAFAYPDFYACSNAGDLTAVDGGSSPSDGSKTSAP